LRLPSPAWQEALPDARRPLYGATDGSGAGPLETSALEAWPILSGGPTGDGAFSRIVAGVQGIGSASSLNRLPLHDETEV
jgi:hypothetical protein